MHRKDSLRKLWTEKPDDLGVQNERSQDKDCCLYRAWSEGSFNINYKPLVGSAKKEGNVSIIDYFPVRARKEVVIKELTQ